MQNPIQQITVLATAIALALCLHTAVYANEGDGAADADSVIEGAISGTYRIDRTHANLTWKVMHKGLAKYVARFTDFEAVLEFDADDPENSELQVTVDPASVRTDYPQGKPYKFAKDEDFDAKLAGVGWLDAAAFPAIIFRATNIERTSEKMGKITGDLTFLGVKKSIILDVTLNGTASNLDANTGALGFSGKTTIKRSEFGLAKFIPIVADEVEIYMEVEFYLDNEE